MVCRLPRAKSCLMLRRQLKGFALRVPPQVADLKELARENDLHGYSTMRKTELVDFLAEALPGDYQI